VCHRICSAVTHLVNVLVTAKINIFMQLLVPRSGQLLFLGSLYAQIVEGNAEIGELTPRLLSLKFF